MQWIERMRLSWMALRKESVSLCLFLSLFLLIAGSVNISHSAESREYAAAFAELAPPPSNEALAQIPDLGRKLLAMRSYVRMGPKLVDRWSWTDEQIKAFEGSAEQQKLLAEIAAVNAHFVEVNPGYQIYVHGTVRSLDEQIRKWNSNESVGEAAAEILASWIEAFGTNEDADAKETRSWLANFRPSKRANLAAPGLTLHGRAHAIDFQVMQNGQIIAGANSKQIKTVWRAESWDKKLKDSMLAAGPSFIGPLTNPDEPWHYDYKPETLASTD